MCEDFEEVFSLIQKSQSLKNLKGILLSEFCPIQRSEFIQYVQQNMEVLDRRIIFVKTVVSLIPETNQVIYDVLQRKKHRLDFELHFTLFCYIDDIFEVCATEATPILMFIENYLMECNSKTARAFWMAGDLLGDHWPVETALPALLNVAQNGRYVAGRLGGLIGLSIIIKKYSTDRQIKQIILECLDNIYRHDRSKYVSKEANSIISKTIYQNIRRTP